LQLRHPPRSPLFPYTTLFRSIGSMYSLFFTPDPVFDLESAQKSDTQLFGRYFQSMLKRGVYLAPSQFESLFLSTALKEEHLEKVDRKSTRLNSSHVKISYAVF